MPSQGPYLPSSASGWTNPSYAESDTDSCASATVAIGGAGTTTGMIVLSGFGFSVPAGSVIDGIQLACGYNCSPHPQPEGVASVNVLATKDGSSFAGSYSISLGGQIEIVGTAGGSSDLFGLTLSSGDVNSPEFGFGVEVQNSNSGDPIPSGTTYYLDWAKATVYYSPPASCYPDSKMIANPGFGIRL